MEMIRSFLSTSLILAGQSLGPSVLAQSTDSTGCFAATDTRSLTGAKITQPGINPSANSGGAPFWFSRGETIRVLLSRPSFDGFDPSTV